MSQCQKDNKHPYCWPRNGTRICANGLVDTILLYWPPGFYHENAFLSIDFGNQTTESADSLGKIRAGEQVTGLKGYEKYAEPVSNGSYEKILRITIREWHPVLDSITSTNHAGPTLTIVPPERVGPTATALAGMGAIGGQSKGPGKVASIVIGAAMGAVFLAVVLCWCCKSCCLMDCCGVGKSEDDRVRRQQARRIAREVAAAQPQIDAIKQSAARGEVWTGPVRPGGMWVTDMPRRPSRTASRTASRPASRASDEIRAVNVVEEQVAEERRIEAQRQEIARVEEAQPPAYNEVPAPPRYAP